MVSKLSEKRSVLFISNPDDFLSIPDPESRGQKGTGSRIHNTASTAYKTNACFGLPYHCCESENFFKMWKAFFFTLLKHELHLDFDFTKFLTYQVLQQTFNWPPLQNYTPTYRGFDTFYGFYLGSQVRQSFHFYTKYIASFKEKKIMWNCTFVLGLLHARQEWERKHRLWLPVERENS